MMKRSPKTTMRDPRARVWATTTRILTHASMLAVLGLAIGVASLMPPDATAQVQAPVAVGSPADATTPTQTQQTLADVQLHVGESAALDDGALLLTMVQVSEDSRCPKDVMCVWMGRAVVQLHAVVDGVDRGGAQATLYPGTPNAGSPDREAAVDRHVITLADLQPYPAASQPQPVDGPVATLRVVTTAP